MPAGTINIGVMKGFEYAFEQQTVKISEAQNTEVTFHLRPLKIPQDADRHWVSGDVHVHMNYGGSYRNTPSHLVAQAAAENLSIVEDLIVNKERRFPDIKYFTHSRIPLRLRRHWCCTVRNITPAIGGTWGFST